jgi:hypothetical protein
LLLADKSRKRRSVVSKSTLIAADVTARGQAEAAALAEGLVLQTSSNSVTGLMGVNMNTRALGKPYQAVYARGSAGSKKTVIGRFATRWDAALARARALARHAASAPAAVVVIRPNVTLADTTASAERQGVQLLRTNDKRSAHGYFGVHDCKKNT